MTRASLTVDITAGVVFFFLATILGPIFFGMGSLSWVATLATGVIMSTAFAVRRLSPALALAIAWLGAIVQMVCVLPPMLSDLAILAVLFATAAYGSRVVLWLGFASSIVGAFTSALFLTLSGWLLGTPSTMTLSTLASGVVVSFLASMCALVLAWAAGAIVRANRAVSANREAQRRAEAEMQAEQERGRIARDMHDVVAHSLAVVIAQADGARYAATNDPAATGEALGTISTTARSALSDVRLLLAQLRHRQGDGPQPTLADLENLFDQIRAAGVDVRATISPAPPSDVPASIQLAVYRILQEALTNALRHGDGAAVDVSIAWWSMNVTITVANDARRAPSQAGHGIIGMRERAQLVGGRTDVEYDVGRFVVRAEIPLGGRR